MFTVVKNQLRVCFLSLKYNLMREMLNKVTFLTNISFMILNDAAFIIQWMILFYLKKDIGGYTLYEVMLLWGLTASSFGLSHILFAKAFSLPELIINGKLDAYLVMPKNVLLSIITSAANPSAIGDFLYGFLVFFIFSFRMDIHAGFLVKRLFLFVFFIITGTVIITAFAVLMGSLTFWFVRADAFGIHMLNCLISFATYPDGIFQGIARILLYSIIPVGMAVYQPVHIMMQFDLGEFFMVSGYALALGSAAVFVFYRGLRSYTSGNIMQSRI